MRGTDYRRLNNQDIEQDHESQTLGLALLLAKPCNSTRDYHQALGRVGRYDELGKLYKLENVAKFDEAMENQRQLKMI